ncbi:TonB-dependent receptor [Gluconacetobacter liquefaciens]|uniref:TonB-dependent receptor n=2 Tax=Gluconacetobacter liquefaciens TaxID=89584 RepID=A0A370GF67_GLULI|nr:TonB-dependent receptor [Gluconacetobacter liquefaciens]RDI40633.1 TonB-dependent receptor [Gluconacetobacter liquefaciens]GBQ94065.1 TonB-dependent receptor [Gluconacetobacter liquefaciens NRIC 0522]GEB36903.1 TonB-dependent receptor [Gluconacetobacter liquefaciens]
MRHTLRYSLLLSASLCVPTLASARPLAFDLPAQPLAAAVVSYDRLAGVQVILDGAIAQGVMSQPVRGMMEPEEALSRMLRGTGISVASRDGSVITLAPARAAGHGTISGRVVNTATGQYLRNAEIHVENTNIATYADEDGAFRLADVPAGKANIVVRYTGLKDARATVFVAAGKTLSHNVDMIPLPFSGASNGQVVTVTGVRSGEAAALMKRRLSMNAVNAIDADNFGALTMGDVGEFMKNMPGVSLDYTEVDASAVRIGGLDPKYSLFTLDGARMATATSNNNAGRQNSFEQMSITGISRIELNNTLTAAMDADAPGGSINLVSKYAFERRRRVLQAQVGGIGTSDSSFAPTYMSDDRKHGTIFPSGQASYADVFFGGRLGVAVSGSYNANFVEQDRVQTDWSYLPDGTVMPYRVMWRPGPKFTHREAVNGAVDYKISDRLSLGIRGSWSFYDVEYYNQYTYLTFGTTSKSYAAPGSTPTHIVVNPQGTKTNVNTQYSHRYAGTPTMIATPKLEYKDDAWDVTLRGAYSSSEFNFRDGSNGFFVRDDSQLSNIGFTLDRASSESPAYMLQQTAGQSWSVPTNWSPVQNSVRTSQSNALDHQYGGNLDIKRKVNAGPVQLALMAGGSIRTNEWSTNEGAYKLYNYTGSGSDSTIPYTNHYQFAIDGFNAGNFNNQNWRADNNYATWSLFREHPEYFTPDTVGNLTRQYANNHRVKETIDAAYMEFQGQWRKLKFDFGARYEGTHEGTLVAQTRSAAEVAAAGYAANSVNGVNYQYYNGHQLWKTSDYGNWFLSGGLKYDITRHLLAQFAFSQSILRPDYGNMGGAISVNDSTQIVTVPNPLLRPEQATKYYVSLQYYVEPAGIFAASAYRLDVRDLQQTGMTILPQQAGYKDSDYSGYTYVSTVNLPGVHSTNGVTLEFDRQLTFLPGALKGLGLRGSWNWVDPDSIRVNLPEYSANWGIRYAYGPVDLQFTGNYQSRYRVSALSNTPTTANNGILYHADRFLWNVSASYKVSRMFALQIAGRNIFNAPDIVYSNTRRRVQLYSVYGSMWNVALKGTF